MTNLIKAQFEGKEISFREDGWFNATEAAAKYGKRPTAWLNQRDTVEYVVKLAERMGTVKCGILQQLSEINSLRGDTAASRTKLLSLIKKTKLIQTKQGPSIGGGGTWMHPKLGVAFARWLDVEFAIWCDFQIDNILRKEVDQKKLRSEAASSFKVMQSVLQIVREEQGKLTHTHHYSNEARLINYALSGKFQKLNRDELPAKDLDMLAKFEEKNAVLIGRGVAYKDRKAILEQYALDLRTPQIQGGAA